MTGVQTCALPISSVDVEFTLTETDLAAILKATSVLKSPHIGVESDGEKIFVKAFDAKDNSAHTNSIEVAEGNGKSFSFVFLPENFKMILEHTM